MVAIKLSAFGGMVPGTDDRLLPDNGAALAQNTWLYSGALQGLHTLKPLHTCTNTSAKSAFRIPMKYFDKDHLADSYWLEFNSEFTDVVRTPMVGDQYKRYYWVESKSPPRYNTTARIAAGSASYLLGIPVPGTAAGVVPTGGVSATLVSRAYVYTWVSAYGEEGPTSDPTLVNGKVDASWDVTLTAPTLADTTDRNLTHTRIYRTITSTAGAATYFLVAELPIATLTYSDIASDADLSNNNQLQSTNWTAPPTDLEGMIALPNGVIAGFRDNEIWFSEPYRPHAWPAAYSINVASPIVGLGVNGQTLVVCTSAHPYAVTGIHPSAMSQVKLSQLAPCVSRGSIVSSQFGVYYATIDGIALVAAGTVTIVSRGLVTKDRWQEEMPLNSLSAVMLGGAYYARGTVAAGCFDDASFELPAFEQYDFTGATSGAMIDLNDQRVAWTKLSLDTPVDNVFADLWTGEVFVMFAGVVYWLDVSPTAVREPYRWKSKVFQPSERKNLEAMRIWFDIPDGVAPTLGAINTDQGQSFDPATQYGIIRVYADGVQVAVRELRTSGEFMRLPSGFKATYWQFDVEAQVRIYSIEAATCAKELRNV